MSSKALKPRASAKGTGVINQISRVAAPVRELLVTENLKVDARAERDEMRRVLNTMDAGFWDWDIPSSEVWYSDYALALAGYELEDVVSAENFFQLGLHPEDAPHISRAIQAVISGESESYRYEFRYRHKQGHWLWFESTGQAVIRTDAGVALRIFGQLTCIEDLKQQQADAAFLVRMMDALRDRSDAQRLEQVAIQMLGEYLKVDRVRIGHFDAPRRMLTVTQEWKSGRVSPMLGEWQLLRAEDVLRKCFAEGTDHLSHDVASDPNITDDVSRAFYKTVQCAAFVTVPLVIDGGLQATFAVSNAEPRVWQPREVHVIKRVALRLWDTILRARAEEERAASQKLLRFALRAANMSARRVNMETGEVLASENFQNMFGGAVDDEMTTEEYIAHAHPEDRAHLMSCFVNGQADDHSGAHRFIAADDTIHHVAAFIQFEERPDATPGAPRFASTVLRNITRERETELAAERARDQVLKNSRLSAMGVMASTLAHELTQPLTTAANYLSVMDLMLERDGDCDLASLRDFSQRAREKVLETGETIRRIRSFTVSGEVEAQPTPLRALVFKALSGLFGNAVTDGMSISNTVPTGLQVNVDALQIEHVISNLVRNAKDVLADRSDGRIRISAQQNGDMALLLISDNGPGMPDDVAADIFSPFVTSKDQGMGLGLAICRTMVEANGGKISLKDHGPGGTVFSITLPLVDSDQNCIKLKG